MLSFKNYPEKQVDMTILISDKIDFNPKTKRDEEGRYIMTKESLGNLHAK